MPIRVTLRQLEYFVAVGEAGSIALASERVNVSSPSISSAIGQLEVEFGLPLFVRKHARGLALTRAGRELMAKARRVLAEAGELLQLADDLSGNVQGPLAVGCLMTFAQIVLPQLRRSFQDQYAGVRVSQSELDQAEIFARLRDGSIDVALTYDLGIPPDLSFVPLVELPPFVMLAPGHPLADRAALTIEELTRQPMVLLDLPLSAGYFLSFFARRGLKPVIAERTRDLAVARGLVANDFGYAFANFRPMNSSAPDGRPLRFIPLASAERPMVLGLALVSGSEVVPAVTAFVDHCRSAIARRTMPGIDLEVAGGRGAGFDKG